MCMPFSPPLLPTNCTKQIPWSTRSPGRVAQVASGGEGKGTPAGAIMGTCGGKSQATPGRGKDPWFLGNEGVPPTYLRALGSDHGKVPNDAGL